MNGIPLPPEAERIGITARPFASRKRQRPQGLPLPRSVGPPICARGSSRRCATSCPASSRKAAPLLAGRPKLGKCWLMLDVGLAVAAGRYCLGEARCEQGDVLYLALEDNERRLQRRIDKVLGAFSEEWPAAFEYATEWPRANEGGIEAIRDWIIAREEPAPRRRGRAGDVQARPRRPGDPIRGGLRVVEGAAGARVRVRHRHRRRPPHPQDRARIAATPSRRSAARSAFPVRPTPS